MVLSRRDTRISSLALRWGLTSRRTGAACMGPTQMHRAKVMSTTAPRVRTPSLEELVRTDTFFAGLGSAFLTELLHMYRPTPKTRSNRESPWHASGRSVSRSQCSPTSCRPQQHTDDARCGILTAVIVVISWDAPASHPSKNRRGPGTAPSLHRTTSLADRRRGYPLSHQQRSPGSSFPCTPERPAASLCRIRPPVLAASRPLRVSQRGQPQQHFMQQARELTAVPGCSLRREHLCRH